MPFYKIFNIFIPFLKIIYMFLEKEAVLEHILLWKIIIQIFNTILKKTC